MNPMIAEGTAKTSEKMLLYASPANRPVPTIEQVSSNTSKSFNPKGKDLSVFFCFLLNLVSDPLRA